jgi:hypothetical protein
LYKLLTLQPSHSVTDAFMILFAFSSFSTAKSLALVLPQ